MNPIHEKMFYRIPAIVTLTLFLTAVFSFFSETPIRAQNPQQTISFQEYNRSVLETTALERGKIDALRQQLSNLEASRESFKGELNAYRVQLSAHGNLLLTPTTELEVLEKECNVNRISFEQINKRLKDLSQQIEKVTQDQATNEEQHRFNEEQLAEIKSQKLKESESKALAKNLEALVKTLAEKQKLLGGILAEYSHQKTTLEEISNALSSLSQTFDEQIRDKNKEKLFERRDTLIKFTQFHQMGEEARQIYSKIAQVLSSAFWKDEFKAVWELEGFRLFSFFLLLILTILFLIRMNRLTRGLTDRSFYADNPWRLTTVRILSNSFSLIGSILFLFIFTKVRSINSQSIFSLIETILWIFLLVKWGLDAIRLIDRSETITLSLPDSPNLICLIRSIGGFALSYVVLDWLIDGNSLILLIVRVIFEISLLSWGLRYRKKMLRFYGKTLSEGSSAFKMFFTLSIGVGAIILSGGPLLELIGFGEFALYWYISWAKTAAVFLWATLIVRVLKEWDLTSHLSEDAEFFDRGAATKPIRWIIFRICWLIWGATLVFGLFFAWGARQQVITGFIQLLKYPFQIGEMQLSLMGVIYALLALFFTHLLVKAFRFLLKEKFLLKSGFDRGVQESITNITAYLIWGLGILISLHAIGFTTASLAVVLGALGIGLGFGLQNIFNNFISGIILLFERPIQAGDDIEINGIWAVVKKINVRSTVVQTYDNASIIIPNSEFISNHVTNWSFKDRRLRRKIAVGVAYDSDTALVKDTLLEIADAASKVLRSPAPDVLFTEFADSALIFTLRIWTTIDQMVRLESDIRYEIDRIFRERKINIAFPQRDVHIYHMDKPLNGVAEKESE
jgi:potassium-dependent mechanosensitive channel